MKKIVLLLVVLSLVAVVAIAQDDDGTVMTSTVVQMMSPDGMELGEVFIAEHEAGVSITANIMNLEPGFHGFHLHTTGVCEVADDSVFTSAGGHWNPSGDAHNGHAGDLPSLLVMEDGRAFLSFVTDRFDFSDLFDEDGTAVIIHAGPDNYANIPERYGGPDEATLGAGDAGSRAGCGVIGMMEMGS